jgi:hypothetical protein
MKHLAGNLRSRWTDFLTTDGEKPDRDRDREFELEGADDAATLRAAWDRGWETLFASLGGLTPGHLESVTVRIRGEDMTVVEAILRQRPTTRSVGQIVYVSSCSPGPRGRPCRSRAEARRPSTKRRGRIGRRTDMRIAARRSPPAAVHAILAAFVASVTVHAAPSASAGGAVVPTCRTESAELERLIADKARTLAMTELCQFRRYDALDDVEGDGKDDFVALFTVEGPRGAATM